MHKTLDHLLAAHFQRPLLEENLDDFQQEVWRRIHAREAMTGSGFEAVLSVFSLPRFQMASLAFALLVGVIASTAIPPTAAQPVSNAVNATGMGIFAANANYLPSATLTAMDYKKP